MPEQTVGGDERGALTLEDIGIFLHECKINKKKKCCDVFVEVDAFC